MSIVKIIDKLPSQFSIKFVDLFNIDSYRSTYDSKYQEQIKNNEFYSILLQIKSKIRKDIKSGNKFDDVIRLSVYLILTLAENNQFEALIDYIKYFIDELKLNSQRLKDVEVNKNIMILLKLAFINLPKNEMNKSSLQLTLLSFLNKNCSLSLKELKKEGFFRIFAEDALLNDSPIEGYKYAISDESSELLVLFIDLHLDQTNDGLENLYFIIRIILELINSKNYILANEILVTKAMTHTLNKGMTKEKLEDNFNNFKKDSHPLVNFTLVVLNIILNNLGFDLFKSTFTKYKKWLDNNSNLDQYVNEISKSIYNKPIMVGKSSGGMLGLLSNFL